MDKIRKVIIYGLGSIGSIFAVQISKYKEIETKVLIDEERYNRYKKEPTIFNNEPYIFNYILPSYTNFKADLIIIATKNAGLKSAIRDIENFIQDNTIIISLLNGITSEEEIAKIYGSNKVITSFYIGHSSIRDGRNIKQDGIYKIVVGITKEQENNKLKRLIDFFERTKINYEVSKQIENEYWKKFIINVGINQLSAVTGLTLKEIKKDKKLTILLKGIMKEAENIAAVCNIKEHAKIYKEAEKFLLEEIDDAFPSMLQDIIAKRETEVDIFAGTIIKLGEKYNIETPLNKDIYKIIKDKESKEINII